MFKNNFFLLIEKPFVSSAAIKKKFGCAEILKGI